MCLDNLREAITHLDKAVELLEEHAHDYSQLDMDCNRAAESTIRIARNLDADLRILESKKLAEWNDRIGEPV